MPDDTALKAWFQHEVLSLEPQLTRYIRRHWRTAEEIADIRQDVYERALLGAARQLPARTGAYVFAIAHNVIVNRVRRAKVISIEAVAEIEHVGEADWLTPHRHVDARRELQRVLEGMERLPPRCREVIRLRKVEGLSSREVARRLGIGIDAVDQQTMLGMRALTDFMLGGEGRIRRRAAPCPAVIDGATRHD